jgi:two-component system, LuxR family, sensor kinase FixL
MMPSLSGDNMNDARPIDDSHVPTVSEARLSSVLDTAVDGIVVMDERGRIMVFNHACERLFGYRAEEVVGENVRLLMPPEYSDHHDRFVDAYTTTGVRRIIGIGREVKGRRKDGEVFPIELSVGEAGTPDGRQFVGVMRDLRPRKEAEERLSELQGNLIHMTRVSAMDEMGAALAHELNQPLTAIMLYLQAAARAKPDMLPEATRMILGKAVREAERAGSIIQRMRQFVEKREPERKTHDLRLLVDEAVELALLGNRMPPRVSRDYPREPALVSVDAVQIQQIVVNLTRNALEALKERSGPQLRLTIRPANGGMCFSVADSGPGIPPEILPTLFKAFSTSKRTGLGLGLAISKTIAQNHGGDLAVDPGGDGRGATFSLQLPTPAATSA